jgi:DNA recombination protein RmuC
MNETGGFTLTALLDSFLTWFAGQNQFAQLLSVSLWAFFCGVILTSFLLWIFFRFVQDANRRQITQFALKTKSLTSEVQLAREKESDQRSQISRLRTQLEQEKLNSKEKLILLDQAKEQLRLQFAELAAEILEEKSSHFGRESQEKMERLLAPFQEQLSSFRQQVDTIHHAETRDRSALQREIATLRDVNQQMSQEALNLTRALKGDKRIQGSWGELVLERVLEQSALRKGVEYETQISFRDEGNRIQRPDVIVHLPEERDVIIDSKVSLSAWEEYVNCEEGEQQERYLRSHVKAIRDHVKVLGAKDYTAIPEIRSLDFVLMFMPVEAAFVAAFQTDDSLFQDAVTNKVILVSPTTLLTSLRTIESIWSYEKQSQNAREIARQAAALYDKFCAFTEDMERMGKQLSTLQNSYDSSLQRLSRGRGNLISKVENFPQMGVKVKKTIPASIRSNADL